MTTAQFKFSDIRIDGGTQPRVAIDQAIVDEYADAMIGGAVFPPMIVYHDGSAYWLADGFHRYHAYRKAKGVARNVKVVPGTLREALLHSFTANAAHGLRRSNEDKRNAINRMLADSEWSQWSDREIAKQCRVSHTLVASVRSVTGNNASQNASDDEDAGASEQQKRTYKTRYGTKAQMKTGRAKRAATESESDQSEQAAAAEQQEDMPSPGELIAEAHAEAEQATRRAEELEKALASDDKTAHVMALIQRAEHAERRRDELMADLAAAGRVRDFYQRQLARCGKALGIKDLDAIAPAVEAMVRGNGAALESA